MKKSLIALAATAAFAFNAHAQSNVEVYGILDAWFGSSKVDGVSVKQIGAGGLSSSRLGFRGAEDLGGGLKAHFLFETALDNVNGAGLTDGGREAYVGLSGNFGEVYVGDTLTAFDDVNGATVANFDSKFSPEAAVFATYLYSGTPGQQFRYVSPTFSGVTVVLSQSVDGDKAVKKDVSSFAVKYENGPLAVNLGYQKERDVLDLQVLADDLGWEYDGDLKLTRLGASYDLGVVAVKANYGAAKLDVLKTKEYSFGVDYPLTAATTLSAGYAKTSLKVSGDKAGKASGYGVSVGHALSKRTTVYAGYTKAKFSDEPKTQEIKSSLYAVGIKHAF